MNRLRGFYRENEALVVLSFTIMFVMMGFGMTTPITPLFARELGASVAVVGVVVSAYGLARLLANVPVGIGANRFGRKPIFVGGAFVTAIAATVMAFSPNFTVFLIGRVIAGAAAPMFLLTGQIMVSDVSTIANRGRNMAVYQGFFVLGGDIGPLPGGFIADLWGERAAFGGYALTSLLVAAIAIWRLKETMVPGTVIPTRGGGHGHQGKGGVRAGVAVGMKSWPFVLIAAIGFSAFFTRTAVVQNIIPLFGVESLGLSKTQVGAALTIGRLPALAGLFAMGILADRYGRKVLLVPGTLLGAASLVLWSGSNGFVMFAVGSLLWGAATSVSGSIPVIYVADIVRPDQTARALSMLRTASDAGYFVGPVLIGAVATVWGYPAAILVAAAVMAAPTIPFLLFAPEPLRAAPKEESVATPA